MKITCFIYESLVGKCTMEKKEYTKKKKTVYV